LDTSGKARLFFKSHSRSPYILYVNRDNRAIALKHYRALLQDSSDPRRKIYFHLAFDIGVFPNLHPLREDNLHLKTSTRLLATFEEVHSLELHRMWWSGFRTFITGPGVEQSIDIWNMDIANFERATVVPAHFKGRDEPFPVLDTDDPRLLSDPERYPDCKDSLRCLCTTKANADPEFKIPEIIVIIPEDTTELEERDSGTDDEYESGEEQDGEQDDEQGDGSSHSDESEEADGYDECRGDFLCQTAVGLGLDSGGTISARCKITLVVCQLATDSLHESSPGRLSRNSQLLVRIIDTQSS
jgi:hypothetical protein